MSIHFSRSLRRLEADSPRRRTLLFFLTLVVLALWTLWFLSARVPLYATTDTARLEVDRENHPVDAPVGGRVIAAPLSVGRPVKQGDVLLELDASPERLAQSEAQAKADPTVRQITSLRDELSAQQSALADEQRSAQAASAEGESKIRETTSAAELAADEAARIANLRASGLVSEVDALRARRLAEQRQEEARTAEFSARRLMRDLEAREQDRVARVARLRNEIAALEGTHAEAMATSDRLDYEIGLRQVRAPIGGTLAEMSPLKAGSMVRPGDRICTIVPDGALKVVALFAPSVALGRIREGQIARVRLEGFPWTQYGSTPARVARVAGELRDGQIRVELALDPESGSVIPFQHGLPADVDIEVERISPMAMVLRSAGARMRVSATPARAAGAP